MIELDINELPRLYLIEKYRQDNPWEIDKLPKDNQIQSYNLNEEIGK